MGRPGFGKHRDSYTATNGYECTADVDGLSQRYLQSTRNRLRFLAAFQTVEDDRELVASKPRRRVVVAHGRADSSRNRLQYAVTRLVTMPVIDRFEVIEIDVEHRQWFVLSRSPRQRRLELLLEQDPIRKARQWIMVSHVGNPLSCAVAVHSVEDRGKQPCLAQLRQSERVVSAVT